MDLHVNAILQANPFDRPWRKHVARRFYAKARQSVSVLPEPSLKCPSAHSCGICKFVFVCAFHSILFFTSLRLSERRVKSVFELSRAEAGSQGILFRALGARLSAKASQNEVHSIETGCFYA